MLWLRSKWTIDKVLEEPIQNQQMIKIGSTSIQDS